MLAGWLILARDKPEGHAPLPPLLRRGARSLVHRPSAAHGRAPCRRFRQRMISFREPFLGAAVDVGAGGEVGVPFADDERPVGALGPCRAHEPLGDRV